MIMPLIYTTYFVATIGLFFALPPRTGALVAYMGGILFLPVADFPPDTITRQSFTVDVIGMALPNNLGLTKALVVPWAILAGLTLRHPGLWRQLRFVWQDAVVLVFCLWPLAQFVLPQGQHQGAIAQSIYMLGVWAGTWLVARLILTGGEGRRDLVRAIAWSGVLLLPITLLETPVPSWLYSAVYGAHPFQVEGAARYFGYRPIGFLEHGNQFGMWMAMSALAWIAIFRRSAARDWRQVAAGVLVFAAALASQSGGAIILLLCGSAWLFMPEMLNRILFRGALLTGLLAAGVYFSGALPVTRAAWENSVGPRVLGALHATGRGSIGYRIRRDQMALPMIARAPVAGYGRWDWWRPLGSHPWGLPLLLAGQFGIISLLMWALFSMKDAVVQLWRGTRSYLPLMASLAFVDAWLNSYLFFPAILAAGALAGQRPSARGDKRPARSRGGHDPSPLFVPVPK